jgi:hypothetical protein
MSARLRSVSDTLLFAAHYLPGYRLMAQRPGVGSHCEITRRMSVVAPTARASSPHSDGTVVGSRTELSPLTAEEIEQFRNAPSPFPKADIEAMSPQERETLRLRSRSIPLVVSHAPLDIVYEDAVFLVVSKPSWLKMHPIHRFQGTIRVCSPPPACPERRVWSSKSRSF